MGDTSRTREIGGQGRYKEDKANTRGTSRVRMGQFLSDAFPIHCGLKQGDALSPLLFNLALEYAIRKVQDNREGLELNGLHQLFVYADDVDMLGKTPQTNRENTEILLEANKAIGLVHHDHGWATRAPKVLKKTLKERKADGASRSSYKLFVVSLQKPRCALAAHAGDRDIYSMV
ncbi:hypothetical protein ANN_27156 [Periplaneta americana]|uniref:Reverse transcriptase domain-containing protein n=1 Tax=Periplaneta americana TaxID=6978 RepID=A0ABQ8RX89_PERAM|nr:hypothetical protein ANN_27156 [Periplaneta americana]